MDNQRAQVSLGRMPGKITGLGQLDVSVVAGRLRYTFEVISSDNAREKASCLGLAAALPLLAGIAPGLSERPVPCFLQGIASALRAWQ